MSFGQFKLRRDSAADWTSNNPTLAQGEQGYETDTRKLKIGDGSTAWTSLPYFAAILFDGDYGDVTVSSNGTVINIDSNTVGATELNESDNVTWSGLWHISGGGNLTPAATPATNAIGYLGSPQMSDQDDYTLVMADAGKHYYHVSGSSHTLTIPDNGSVAFPIGTVIAGVNENGAGVLNIAITTDTLRWGDSTGSRAVAANGSFSLMKVASTVWRLTGDGIS